MIVRVRRGLSVVVVVAVGGSEMRPCWRLSGGRDEMLQMQMQKRMQKLRREGSGARWWDGARVRP